MIQLSARVLLPDNFAPFGIVVQAPTEPKRVHFSDALRNLRVDAQAVLTASRSLPQPLPLIAQVMERHRYSSQTFLPLDVGRYLVVVAPNAGHVPDMQRAQAFIVNGDTGISYAADTWHHPLLVLDRPACFAVLMWRNGTSDDLETVTLAEPIALQVA